MIDLLTWWESLDNNWKITLLSEIDSSKTPTERELLYIINLKRIDCSNQNISTLEPIQLFHHLRELDCSYNPIKSIQKLSDIKSLEELNCNHTKITTLLPLSYLPNLRVFKCIGTKINSLDGLEFVKSLEEIEYPTGVDTTPIRNLPKLKKYTNDVCEHNISTYINPEMAYEYVLKAANIIVRRKDFTYVAIKRHLNLDSYFQGERILDVLISLGIVETGVDGEKYTRFKSVDELNYFMQSVDEAKIKQHFL